MIQQAQDWGPGRYRDGMTSDTDYTARIAKAREGAAAAHLDGLIVTPGANLVYLTGYDAVPLERITALVIPTDPDLAAFVIAPGLERLAALASPIGQMGLQLLTWEEDADPYALIAATLMGGRSGALRNVGVANDMDAAKVLRLRAAMPQVEQRLAGEVLDELRQRKGPSEIVALREAAEAIDRVHSRVPDILHSGRTEAEVGADIDRLIREEGHVSVDFVIVASGPNAASPHHAVSDRVIGVGEPIVIDIGGTMPSGYCSDCTRTYVIGEAPRDFQREYDLLQTAQENAVHAVTPGTTAGAIDAAARNTLGRLAEHFIHRTGHGIGLVTHEEPYIMAGSETIIEPGMAFSVEPGFYIEGLWGARIEDIVICTDSGVESLNTRPRDLRVVPEGP